MSLPRALLRALGARPLLLAVDFDGTLARLRRDRSSASLSAARRRRLARLSAAPGVRVVAVSGRATSDLRRLCRGTGVAACGDHGLRLRGLGREWRHPALRRWSRRARVLAAAARSASAPFAGVRVELKEAAVAVHYRLAPAVRRDPRGLRRALERLPLKGWRIAGGKCVWELRPAQPWGKGHAVLLALRRAGAGAAAVFVGDDATDEEGFAVLRGRAVTVKVGAGATAARFRVRGIAGVDAMLAAALAARR